MHDLLFDMDGILVSIHPPILERLNAEKGTSFTPAHITHWEMSECVGHHDVLQGYFGEVGFFRKLPPIAGAPEQLRRLYDARKNGKRRFNVLIASTPYKTPWSASEKLEWCGEFLPFLPKRNINLIHDKQRFAADLLVDDKPEHLTNYKTWNWNAQTATIDYPFNQGTPCDFRAYGTPGAALEQIVDWILGQS